MKLLVGLGNIGKKYEFTRHNLGFMVLDSLARKNDLDNEWRQEDKFESTILSFTHMNESYTLLKPSTFMNNSGHAVQSFASYYRIPPEEILVIYDDISLPIGTLRVRSEGSAGGHNGVKSIIESLGSDKFIRMRLGIGENQESISTEDYVLSSFHPSEKKEIEKVIEKATENILLMMENGIENYLSTYHGK